MEGSVGLAVGNGEEFIHVMSLEEMKEDRYDFGILEGWFPLAFERDCQGRGILESTEECRWVDLSGF